MLDDGFDGHLSSSDRGSTEMSRTGGEPDTRRLCQFVPADDGLQQCPHIGAGAVKTLVQCVRCGVRLIEVLGVDSAEGFVGVGITGFSVQYVAQDLFCDVETHGTVAAWVIRPGWDRGEQVVALVGKALEQKLDLE
jgi:hypothetical protein